MDIGSREGGAEYFGIQLARFLNKQEFDVAIFIMWYGGSEMEQQWLDVLLNEGLQVAGLIRPGRHPLRDLWPISKSFWAFVNSFKPQIIHTHSQRGDLLALVVKWFHPLRPISIRTVHIDQPWLNRWWADVVFNRALFPCMFDEEIAVSKIVQEKLNKRRLARILGRRAELCYNGIDARFFSQEFQKEPIRSDSPPNLPDVYPRVGFIGRLVNQKGVTYLLQAMRIVNQYRLAHLFIIGTGPLESELRHQVQELGLDGRVHFLGSRCDIMKIIPCLDALVLPSLWEGLSTVLLEAMAL
ncbi:MAG: glycosyltransferase, partial [Anaerolineae bacterium]